MIDLEFSGKRALVTGGSKGIGAAVAGLLHRGGAGVLATARSRPADWDAAIGFVSADLATAEGCAAVVAAATARFGVVDILIHVMGGSTTPRGGFAALDDAAWQKDIAHNLYPAVRLDRALLPAMIGQGSGVVVHVTSTQARSPVPGAPAYSAAKAALANYSKGLAREVAPHGVRVVRVAPGLVESGPATAHIAALAQAQGVDYATARDRFLAAIGGIPIGRPAQPAEVADLILFLASGRAAGITGSEFTIDGGMTPAV